MMPRMLLAVTLVMGFGGAVWGQAQALPVAIKVDEGYPKIDQNGEYVARGTISVIANTSTVDPKTKTTTNTSWYVRSIKIEYFDGVTAFKKIGPYNVASTMSSTPWNDNPMVSAPPPAGSTPKTRKTTVTVIYYSVTTTTPDGAQTGTSVTSGDNTATESFAEAVP